MLEEEPCYIRKGDFMEIIQSYTTKNPCYKNANKIKVKGIMLHSVGCPQSKASVFVNQFNSSHACTAVHAFIDANDGKIYQTLPWDYKAWHCGVKVKGGPSANSTHIGVEMCEPKQIKYTGGSQFKILNYECAFKAVDTAWNSAIELFAYLCREYGLNPQEDGVIISHKEGYDAGIASGHGDPDHLFKGLCIEKEYSMNQFRYAVNKLVKTSGPLTNIPVKMKPMKIQTIGGGINIYKKPDVGHGKHEKPTGTGVFTIVEVTEDNWGLLKSYERNRDGWVYLSNPYVTII